MLSRRLAVLAAAGMAAAVFAAYALVMSALFAIRAGVTVALPWWVALVAPAVLYAVLALLALPGMSVAARVIALVVLCAVHAVVAALTAILIAVVGDVPVAVALAEASLSFLPAPLLQLLAVPVMLLPLRLLLGRRSRGHRARRPEAESERARSRAETVPGGQVGRPPAGLSAGAGGSAASGRAGGGAWPSPASADVEPSAAFSAPLEMSSPAAAVPAAAEAPEALVVSLPPSAPAALLPALVVDPASAPVIEAAAEPLPVEPDPVASVEMVAPAASAVAAPEPAGIRPRAPEGDTVAVPFARIATVLPADLLVWDAARVSAELAEPGLLLVPVPVVLPQLAEGFAAVDWSEVMEQFPAAAFRVPVAEVGQRLPDGRLPLPLDEVVRRLPPELFAVATPAADLATLESFPQPFQPLDAAPPLPEPPAAVVGAPEPAPTAVVEVPEPAPTAVVEVPEPAPAAVPSCEPVPSELPAPVAEKPSVADEALIASAGGMPDATPGAAEAPSDRPSTDDEAAGFEATRLARLARALSPVGSLSGSMAELGGYSVYLFRPPTLAPEAALAAVGPALEVLRGPSAPAQLTVRMERGAVVLTPLAGAAVLAVAAAPLDGSLALLEIQSLRCGAPPPGGAVGAVAPDREGTLEPVAGGPAADQLAGALTAFGALAPSVVRDPDGRAELCLLHAPGEPTRELAAAAHATCRALADIDGGGLGPVRSAVLRLPGRADAGARRLALRPVAGRPGHWIALAAPAGDARPGLVQIEIARAAARAAR